MDPTPIRRKLIRDLPKSDLHLHLDGSLRLDTLIELAREHRIALPSFSADGLEQKVFKRAYRNLNEYLRGFAFTVAVLQHEEALERAAAELAEDNQAEGVRYIEVRFAPQLHTSAGLSIEEALRAVDRGLGRAATAFNRRAAVRSGAEPPFRYGIIACAMRYFEQSHSRSLGQFLQAHAHAPPRDVFAMASLELARTAVHLAKDEGLPIVGFDLAGREKGYPAGDHWRAYQVVHDGFLGKTVHAGEDYGPESIFQAITDLHAERLGHGTHLFSTRSIRDPRIQDRSGYVRSLVEYIGDRRITLEVCLTSNTQTIPRLKDLRNHPFG
ncbi:MAG: adenosine deaminase family protein, partial [Planctomycetes bacterium]|nr:adenosine deaminase family protein [Planctomycetota bacterium]